MKLISLKEYPGYYAGDDGIIYSIHSTGLRSKYHNSFRPLKGGLTSAGYLHVILKIENKTYISKDIHPLICEAFHGLKPNKNYTVAHLDGNKLNNFPSNLCWKTYSDNHKDKLIHGTHDMGFKNSRAKLTEKQALEVKKLLAESNYTHKYIASLFGVSRVFITKIANGYRYPNLNIKVKH